ncbi:peroxynitrite isomerase THAP4-like isoform X2 [Dermacentor albipictus]|uniref:peroxynitrite isomerase THAP4-like isoform X2 n=1 Tax=Dermacentor albipictus TaxID=60249 RepID=UPI0038FBF89C
MQLITLFCVIQVKWQNSDICYSFPHRDPELMWRWLYALGREDMQPKNHHRVCSQHFTPSCFYAGLDRPCLRPDAVPTEFSGCRREGRNNDTKQRSAAASAVVKLAMSPNKSKKITPSTRQQQQQVQAKTQLTSSSSHQQDVARTSKGHGRTTRAAIKVQEKKACDHAAKQSKTRDAGTNTTLSLENDTPTAARASTSKGQPLPKKRLFQLQHDTKGQSKGQAKGSEDAGTSQPAPVNVEKPVVVNGSKSKDLESDNMSNCSDEPEEHHATDRIVNRDLESGEPGPETTATGALFLHTYCGERTESDEVVQLKKLLQIAKRRLALADQKMNRKLKAFNELLADNKELKFQLSLAQRSTQQQFSVSERLPQELLRDWHENAGRVPHARRYSPTTLRFAADLHACSRTAYEHVACWLPMPTLYLVRRHAAMSSSADSSQESGVGNATTTPHKKGEKTPVGPQTTTVPASRFASSVPRFRKLTAGFPSAVAKQSASTFPPVQSTVKLESAPVMQASHSAPAVFVINNATPPVMATPHEAVVIPEMATSAKEAAKLERTTLLETETQVGMETELHMEMQQKMETQ